MRRRWPIMTAFLLLLTTATAEAQIGQENDRRIKQADEEGRRARAWVNAVGDCAAWVKSSDRGFEVYITGPGRLKMLGTEKARYSFTRCMTEAGQPTE